MNWQPSAWQRAQTLAARWTDRDRAEAKNSQALGLWVCKSPEIPFSHSSKRQQLELILLLSKNGFIELEIWTSPMGNLGSNHQGNLVWLHASGVYGGSQAGLQLLTGAACCERGLGASSWNPQHWECDCQRLLWMARMGSFLNGSRLTKCKWTLTKSSLKNRTILVYVRSTNDMNLV